MEVRGRRGEGGPGEKGEGRERDLNGVLQGSREVVFLSKERDSTNNTNKESNSVYGAKWQRQRGQCYCSPHFPEKAAEAQSG